MKNFCTAYQSGVQDFDNGLVEIASKQLGSHLIVLAPIVQPWRDDKSGVRAAVESGLEFYSGSKPALLSGFQRN